MKYIFFSLISLSIFSCNKQPVAEKGTIEIKTRVFYNASEGLEDAEIYPITKLHFVNDVFMEFVPNIYEPEVTDSIFLIKDEKYYNINAENQAQVNGFDYKNVQFVKSIFDKTAGAMWIPQRDSIMDYEYRNEVNDTILDGKDYKRFSIANNEHLTLFWIEKTDTILPYSLNRIADKDYKGRMTRIDSYERNRDIFTTVVLEYTPKVEKGIVNKLKELQK